MTEQTGTDKGTTHFGYQTVGEDEKQGKVRGVFDSVASKYDVMNDATESKTPRILPCFSSSPTVW